LWSATTADLALLCEPVNRHDTRRPGRQDAPTKATLVREAVQVWAGLLLQPASAGWRNEQLDFVSFGIARLKVALAVAEDPPIGRYFPFEEVENG